MTNRYYLILEESREGFATLDELLKSDLLGEAEFVCYSQPLTTPTLIGNGFANITDKAALEWAGSKDLYNGFDVTVPPMFEKPLSDLIEEWRAHYEDGAAYPNGDDPVEAEQDELDMLHTL